MRNFGALNKTYLEGAAGIISRTLLRFSAVDPASGTTAIIAIWNGQTTRAFLADGLTTNFVGTGGSISVETIEYSTGTDAHRYQITLTGLPSTIDNIMKTYDLTSAPAAVYGVLLDPVAPVSAVWKNIGGYIDDVTITTGALGKPDSIVITIATSAMLLHYGIERKLSDAAHRRAVPGVTFSTSAHYTTSQTVTLGAIATLSFTIAGGTAGSGGYSPSGNWHDGGPGGATTAVVKDAAGNTLGTYTAPGGTVLPMSGITGASGGSIVLTIGAAGNAGGDGTPGVAGYADMSSATATPTPDKFLQYQATAGEVKSVWS